MNENPMKLTYKSFDMKKGLVRILLIIVGSVALGLGLIGVFIPVLPTTPFILLATACFCRSSRKLYIWLLQNPLCGKTLRRYHAGQGISLKAKLIAQGLVVISIGFAALFVIPERLWFIRLLLVLIAVAVITHIALIKATKVPIKLLNSP